MFVVKSAPELSMPRMPRYSIPTLPLLKDSKELRIKPYGW